MRIRSVQHHGNLRWLVDYKDGKGRRRRKFFADRDEAVVFASTVTHGLKRDRRDNPSMTVGWLFDAYLDLTSTRRGSTSQDVLTSRLRSILHVLRDLGVLYVHQFDLIAYNGLVTAIKAQGLAEHTTYGYLTTLKAALNWGAKRGMTSPGLVADIQLPSPQQHRERFLSKTEISTLLAHLQQDPLRLPAALGIYQGLRRGEVCGLRSEHVELAENRLTVAISKNRDWRTIQLHPSLLPHLPDPLPSGYLCRNRAGQPWTLDWMTHRARSVLDGLGPGWADVSFHTLRHTCASQMAASGKYTLYQIAKFLGHRTIQTTQKYAHLLPEQIRPDW